MKRANYYLPQPLLDRLEIAKQKLDLSASEIIRNAIAEYLERLGL
jgi:metal-responsive CopG/Arc/MetJ family transcriptional regulator